MKYKLTTFESLGFSDLNFAMQTDIKGGLEQQNFVRVFLGFWNSRKQRMHALSYALP